MTDTAPGTTGLPTSSDAIERCRADGEFLLAARHWTGGYRIQIGDHVLGVTIEDGVPVEGVPEPGAGVIELQGEPEVWEPMLRIVPPRIANTVSVMARAGLTLNADPLLWWQYLPATERFIELLRSPGDPGPVAVDESGEAHRHSTPVGRYVHVPIDGHEYRIYYETAGQGIPLLLQHTAGAHSVQWRHLFERPEITDRFQLIAYDLPFHGKSIPPVSARWWEQEYRLTGDFLRQVPVRIAEALNLVDPAFMGCSVGGLLALDLALHHPDIFSAVVSVEGALHIGSTTDELEGFFHPQVSNMTKARMMEGLCAPTSPLPYIKEVSQTYASGWPPVFLGDLHYYLMDYDLRDRAHEIDTTECAVHILNGEYDYSGTIEKGRAAHAAIAGSTHRAMPGMGHFPMSEDPDRFMDYLLPVLDSVAAAAAAAAGAERKEQAHAV